VSNFDRSGFNDRASSLRVDGGYWLFCTDALFEGVCRTFGPGEYAQLPWEINRKISSGRRIHEQYPYGGPPARPSRRVVRSGAKRTPSDPAIDVPIVDDIAGLRRILIRSRTIAVVGLSANWYRPSYFAAKYMRDYGYRIIPVNPAYKEVLGERCYPDL